MIRCFPLRMLTPDKILAKAELWKRKSHRLSLDLRLKSVADARRFLHDDSIVLWNAKAELPNLLDAMAGQVTNGKQRKSGKNASRCDQWRKELIHDSDFVECPFFRNLSTVLHQDLWPYATVL